MKNKIIGIVLVIIIIIFGILAYDYYKINSYQSPESIKDPETGKVISTPINAIQTLPPDGIILKSKPF